MKPKFKIFAKLWPMFYGWLMIGLLTGSVNSMEPELDIESDIVVNNASISARNLSNSFYEVDDSNSTTLVTSTSFPTTVPKLTESDNNLSTVVSNSNLVDSLSSTTTSSSSSSSTNRPSTRLEVSVFTKPLTSSDNLTTTFINSTTSTTSTTTSAPEVVTISFGSGGGGGGVPTNAATISSFDTGSYAELRLRSNRVTIKPDVITQPSTELRKKFENDGPTFTTMTGSVGPNWEITAPAEEEEENKVWKIVLHGTNMNEEELRMCNRTLIEAHLKPYSRRKVARYLKKELDKKFEQWNYRFSIVLSSTSRNTMGKALHGIWMSVSLDGVHYFVTATYKVVQGPKLNEEQMNKIEYWCLLHTLASRNMTGYRKYNRISQKIKADLDREYGHGNVWSVIIVKNRFFVKAKVLEDVTNHVEFSRLNSGHYIVFRGGQDIPESKTRNSRMMNIFDSSFSSEDEAGDEINFFR